jgi:hypothetical protein
MSCTNCGNLGSNCSCSDNCPTKTSDLTVFDGSFNIIEVPCDASLNDVLTLLESYTTNMVAELSTMTSVTIGAGNCIGLAAGTYSIQQVIDAILEKLCEGQCDLEVSISNDDPFELTANLTGGTAPFTYSWTVADNWNMWSLTNATSQTVNISPNESEGPVLDGCGQPNSSRLGLIKVEVTDANGCKAKDSFLYINIICGG